MLVRLLFLVGSLHLPLLLGGQSFFTGASMVWDQSFHEWELFVGADGEIGSLTATWHHLGDYSQWDYRIGENTGTLKMKWKDNPEEWELRGNNRIVTARTVWRNDRREWRVQDQDLSLVVKTRWGDSLEDWQLRSDEHGAFEMYTAWEGDLRDWLIVDELDDTVSLELKTMLVFLCLFQALQL